MSEGSGTAPEPGAGSGSDAGKVPEQRTSPPEKAPEETPEKAPEKAMPPEMRIGHAERSAALSALDEHFEAGRLDVTEYGERSAVAGAAVVASELTALFRDLPAPHPDLPGRPGTAPSPGTPEAWDAVATRREAAPERSWAEVAALALPVLLIAAMVVLVVVFENPGGFALFPFVFILAHRFGPHRRR